LIARGPMLDGEHAFVLADDWLGARPRVDRDRALAELARRYLVGHGPADERDLAKWAELPLRDARAGLRAIASELEHRSDGLVNLRGARTRALPAPRLLGPFDPLLLGWRSRELVVDRPQKAITNNGIIRAIALVDGRAAGTWGMRQGRVHLDLWQEPNEDTAAALADEAAAIEAYLARDRHERPA
jgi:Winged helix DNA-binding domain